MSVCATSSFLSPSCPHPNHLSPPPGDDGALLVTALEILLLTGLACVLSKSPSPCRLLSHPQGPGTQVASPFPLEHPLQIVECSPVEGCWARGPRRGHPTSPAGLHRPRQGSPETSTKDGDQSCLGNEAQPPAPPCENSPTSPRGVTI